MCSTKITEFDHVKFPKSISSKNSVWREFLEIDRSSHQSCSIKKMFLEISQNSQEDTCARDSFLINLQAPAGTNAFLWFLRNFLEYLFHRTHLEDCFCLVFQNQPFLDLLQNRCSWIIHKIRRKTVMLELLF